MGYGFLGDHGTQETGNEKCWNEAQQHMGCQVIQQAG